MDKEEIRLEAMKMAVALRDPNEYPKSNIFPLADEIYEYIIWRKLPGRDVVAEPHEQTSG